MINNEIIICGVVFTDFNTYYGTTINNIAVSIYDDDRDERGEVYVTTCDWSTGDGTEGYMGEEEVERLLNSLHSSERV